MVAPDLNEGCRAPPLCLSSERSSSLSYDLTRPLLHIPSKLSLCVGGVLCLALRIQGQRVWGRQHGNKTRGFRCCQSPQFFIFLTAKETVQGETKGKLREKSRLLAAPTRVLGMAERYVQFGGEKCPDSLLLREFKKEIKEKEEELQIFLDNRGHSSPRSAPKYDL